MSKNVQIGILVIVGILLLLIVLDISQRIRLRKQIEKEWGKVPRVTNKDKEESLKKVWELYRGKFKTESEIDDITWHDLDLIHVYELLNATKSSIGAETLYRKLRSFNFDSEDRRELKSLQDFFRENDDMRQKMQYELARVGKLDNNFASQYLFNPVQNKLGLDLVYKVMGIMPFLLILGAVITRNSFFGFALIVVIVVNVLTYQVQKEKIQSELVTMRYLVNMISLAKQLSKVRSPFQKELKSLDKKLSVIRKVGFVFRVKSGSEAELIFDYLTMVFLLPFISYNIVLDSLKKHREETRELMDKIGTLDMAIALLNFEKVMPYTCEPKFVSDKVHVVGKEMYHPLLSEPVSNDVSWEKVTLVTGSNASGKSTYIKGIALNCILAQTVGIVCAENWQMGVGHVLTSMALEDDLFKGDSYFVAEIKSVKRIINKVGSNSPSYCFVDEILRGTNTIERIAASASIVSWLSQFKGILFVATHDIELTEILEGVSENSHFEEQVTASSGIKFDYLVYPGPATSRNALNLLEILDYPTEIVKDAKERAEFFDNQRLWKI